jgi:hypothetical protein
MHLPFGSDLQEFMMNNNETSRRAGDDTGRGPEVERERSLPAQGPVPLLSMKVLRQTYQIQQTGQRSNEILIIGGETLSYSDRIH